jgi:hypothetical protein
MTYQQYYSTVYGKDITDVDQPLLVHRHKRKALPPARHLATRSSQTSL